jgi:hypothetical protein
MKSMLFSGLWRGLQSHADNNISEKETFPIFLPTSPNGITNQKNDLEQSSYSPTVVSEPQVP